ncbi:acetyl-CoA synthetase-like protein [Ramaria rubella]|nr:acetyl-CoA synthetase-like protein [Ramaria rubella]
MTFDYSSAIPLNPQAVDSSTFVSPPLDASLGLHELYDFHLQNSEEHPLFSWNSPTFGLQTLTWGDVARGSHRAAHFIAKHAQTPTEGDIPPVIAVLAPTGESVFRISWRTSLTCLPDTVTSVCLMLGVIRAGYQCFCISPRNSVAGVRHLLKAVGVSEIVVHDTGVTKALATAATAGVETPIHFMPPPEFHDLFPEDTSSFEPFLSKPFKGVDCPAIIMHSSGSTSFPKPRVFTHRFLLQQGRVPLFGEVDLCGEVLSIHAVPMFRGFFFTIFCYYCLLFTGLILSTFSPEVSLSPSTPEKTIRGIASTNTTLLITVPTFLEQWIQNADHVKSLSRLKAILWGAAPLTESSLKLCRENHIRISCYLAATEYGIAVPIIPKHTHSEGPEWFTISPHLSPVFLPQDESDLFELVFLVSPTHTPAVVNTKIDDRDAYASSDLVVRHPLNPNLYKIHGRVDDQIMLSTGEKTNPGPIVEAIIMQSPHVKACAIFGQGRFQNGVIIEPTDSFDPSDLETLQNFKNIIWPAVEEANTFAPSHSRIFKEMIVVANPSKPFETTLKYTPKRHLVISMYQEEIEATYLATAESAQDEISPPTAWNLEDTLIFVREVVSGVLKTETPLGDEDDLFSRGAESLQAMWIRNSILRALRETSYVSIAKELPLNFVYEHPCIASLSCYLVDLVKGEAQIGATAHDARDIKIKEMNDLVAKYTNNFQPQKSLVSFCAEVVVLTGSTGSLGTHLLALLAQDTRVSRIYALNRPGAVSAKQRQRNMWEDHDLDTSLLSDKIVFVELDSGHREGLGIPSDVYEDIRNSVTLIIHNAWTVDFNLTLSSFEPNIRALKNLMGLALNSTRSPRPLFVFTSTVGVFHSIGGLTSTTDWRQTTAIPELPISDFKLAVGTGYTESKCVGERIVEAHHPTLRTLIVRVGQLSGAPNGSWRSREWVPAMVKSGITLGVLPDVQGEAAWLPVHAAASILLEIVQNEPTTPGITFAHLVHPRPVPSSVVWKTVAKALNVPLVPYDQWLHQLQESATRGDNGPAVKLFDFFSIARPNDQKAIYFPRFMSTKTEAKAPRSFGSLEMLSEEDVLKWIGNWKEKGFL